MNGIEGCNVITFNTNHPHLVVGSSITWDNDWQIPVYDEGRWVVGIIRSGGGIAIQICNELAQAGAYLGDARDREINDHNREARCLYSAFELHNAWRGRTDADYEASGAES